jgi:hypothetical protein
MIYCSCDFHARDKVCPTCNLLWIFKVICECQYVRRPHSAIGKCYVTRLACLICATIFLWRWATLLQKPKSATGCELRYAVVASCARPLSIPFQLLYHAMAAPPSTSSSPSGEIPVERSPTVFGGTDSHASPSRYVPSVLPYLIQWNFKLISWLFPHWTIKVAVLSSIVWPRSLCSSIIEQSFWCACTTAQKEAILTN